jgi:predicted Rossmann fold flavoprotein
MIVVVGAGAAGIFAAWRAATLGARVVLLEKTARIGTKILISGGGKCNITHDGPIEEVLRAFRPAEARFIRPACYRLLNTHVVDMLTCKGLEVYTRPDGRIFPVDGTAKDVVRILRGYLTDAGVDLRTDSPVTGVCADSDGITGVMVGSEFLPSRHVVVAVGGSSYPNSGTTGDGWKWCQALGHTIVPVRAALAPIYLQREREEMAERSGISLRDGVLKARQGGKEIARWRGDTLFTHQGISGPCALGISRIVTERLLEGSVSLEVDLAPDVPFEQMVERVRDYSQKHPKRLAASFVEEFLPERLVDTLVADAGIEKGMPFARIDKKARNRLATMLKGWPLGDVRTVPLEKGEVVAGGVALDEVDPQTLRSQIVRGLYLCGEVLDVAGPVGGYNLQAAFATGYVAGETAAKDVQSGS